jgi:phosphate transport system substrate-binding protein
MNLHRRAAALLSLLLAAASPALGQTILIKGPDSMVDLGQQWARAYASSHPQITIQVEGGTVAAAFAALRDHKAALALVPRIMRYAETEASQNAFGRRPAEFKVGVNGVAVYVNAQNPVRVLTYDELAAIFRGASRYWSDLAGPNAPILLYSTATNSAVSELFADEVLNGTNCAAGLRTLPPADLLTAIARDKNGIGCGPLFQAPQDVRPLEIKRAFSSTPVGPTDDAIANRIYPISRYLYVYLDPAANQGPLKAFVDWMRGNEGQQIVKAAGFFPLPPKLVIGP